MPRSFFVVLATTLTVVAIWTLCLMYADASEVIVRVSSNATELSAEGPPYTVDRPFIICKTPLDLSRYIELANLGLLWIGSAYRTVPINCRIMSLPFRLGERLSVVMYFGRPHETRKISLVIPAEAGSSSSWFPILEGYTIVPFAAEDSPPQ